MDMYHSPLNATGPFYVRDKKITGGFYNAKTGRRTLKRGIKRRFKVGFMPACFHCGVKGK